MSVENCNKLEINKDKRKYELWNFAVETRTVFVFSIPCTNTEYASGF